MALADAARAACEGAGLALAVVAAVLVGTGVSSRFSSPSMRSVSACRPFMISRSGSAAGAGSLGLGVLSVSTRRGRIFWATVLAFEVIDCGYSTWIDIVDSISAARAKHCSNSSSSSWCVCISRSRFRISSSVISTSASAPLPTVSVIDGGCWLVCELIVPVLNTDGASFAFVGWRGVVSPDSDALLLRFRVGVIFRAARDSTPATNEVVLPLFVGVWGPSSSNSADLTGGISYGFAAFFALSFPETSTRLGSGGILLPVALVRCRLPLCHCPARAWENYEADGRRKQEAIVRNERFVPTIVQQVDRLTSWYPGPSRFRVQILRSMQIPCQQGVENWIHTRHHDTCLCHRSRSGSRQQRWCSRRGRGED